MPIVLVLAVAGLWLMLAKDVPPDAVSLIFMCGIMLFMAWAVTFLNRLDLDRLNKSKEEPCPPHKWIYDTAGLLFCNKCNARPNYVSRDDHEQR